MFFHAGSMGELFKSKQNHAYALDTKRLSDIKQKSLMPELDPDLEFEKDELILDAVRLLAIAAGGAGLTLGSIASRLHSKSLFIDTVIQPAPRIRMKIEKVAWG